MTATIIILAGPNGAGKTTFARSFLPQEAFRLLPQKQLHSRPVA
jgi:tRNA A37 threonylcarbamoyladenosine biosynthesis protein TsaE